MCKRAFVIRCATLAVLGLIVAATDRVTIAHQESTGVEEVVALNNKYRNVTGAARRLTEAPDFNILVENLPDALEGKVTTKDIEKWIKDEMTRSAPTAVIVSDKDQDERVESPNGNPTRAANLEGYLKRRDAAARFLYLRLSYLKSENGDSFYDIAVEFNRIGVIPTGATFCAVYSTGGYGTFASGESVSDRLKAAVSAQVKKFAVAWATANAKD